MVLGAFGFILYENTLGYFVTARGHHTAAESLRRVARLPAIYAFGAGLTLNALGFARPGPLEELFRSLRGAYSVLGMLIIGLGAAGLRSWRTDGRFLAFCFAIKFAAWPLAVAALVAGAAAAGFPFAPELRPIVFLLGTVPMAANVVAIATELRVHPEKAAVAVLASTAFALFYLPWVSGWLFAH
jgi:predicted permease